MAFSDYLHCDRCVEIHDQAVRDGVAPDPAATPGYTMIYVGGDGGDVKQAAAATGEYLLLCGLHRKELEAKPLAANEHAGLFDEEVDALVKARNAKELANNYRILRDAIARGERSTATATDAKERIVRAMWHAFARRGDGAGIKATIDPATITWGVVAAKVEHEVQRKVAIPKPPATTIDDLDEIVPVDAEDADGNYVWPGGAFGALVDVCLDIASDFGQHTGDLDRVVHAAIGEVRMLAATIRHLRATRPAIVVDPLLDDDASGRLARKIADDLNKTAIVNGQAVVVNDPRPLAEPPSITEIAMGAVFGRHPRPWRVRHDEPYEAAIVDASDERIDGLRAWLDDACFDDNADRLQNMELVVRAVNAMLEREVR